MNYNGIILNERNINDYLLSTYGKLNSINGIKLEVTPYNQADLGDKNDNDCIPTSVTTIIQYYRKGMFTCRRVYHILMDCMDKKWYNKKIGINPFKVDDFYNQAIQQFGLKIKPLKRYIKGIGFNFTTIKNAIDNDRPLILTITSDGRKTYKRHGVVIVGYEEVYCKKEDSRIVKIPLLIVSDNWTGKYSYIDYNKLNFLCGLN